MSLGIRAGSSFPSDKSLVGDGFITGAAVPGGLAFWGHGALLFYGFPDDLGSRGSSLLRAGRSRRGNGAHLIFVPVLVASWKVPEPHVAEPILVRLM